MRTSTDDPTTADFDVAIAILKQNGIAVANRAVLHGGGAETERLADAVESVARVVDYLRAARDAR